MLEAQGFTRYLSIPLDASLQKRGSMHVCQVMLRQILISDRRWGYEADTTVDLSIIALCCFSCHRKAPWWSYFKPSVPLVRGT